MHTYYTSFKKYIVMFLQTVFIGENEMSVSWILRKQTAELQIPR